MGTSRRSLLAWPLAAVLLAVSLQLGSAQGEVDAGAPAPPFDPNDPNAAYLFGFPFCRCSDYRCGTSPYKVLRSNETSLPNGNLRVCFKFQDVGCPSNNPCCNSILQELDKVEFMADKMCSETVAAVTFGGLSVIGSTHFDTEFTVGKIRVTGLNANRAKVGASELCITIKSPCNSFNTFFQSSKLNSDGAYQYAVFNGAHNCCPNKTEEICDCISVFEPNTRWRFRFRGSELKGEFNYFAFNVFTVPSQYCLDVNYRPGACCDQTLDSVEIALAGTFMDRWWKLVPFFWLFDTDGSVMQQGKISTQHKSEFGLIFKNFTRNTTSVPPGSELVITLALNATLWNDTSAFPCGQSHLVDESGICDYLLSGDQVFDGRPVVSPWGDFVPGCCPEGVYLIENPTPLCGCTDNKLESPYRLLMNPEPQPVDRGSTRYAFRIQTVTPAKPEPLSETDCNNMDLDAVRLYVRPEVMDRVTAISLNGVSVPLKNLYYGNDTHQYWLEVRELKKTLPTVGTTWDFDVTVAGASPPSLCSENALGTGECEYVFYGKYSLRDLDYMCCAHGLSEQTTLKEPPTQCSCDASVLHTPYRLDYAGTRAVGSAAAFNFTLTYDALDCDSASGCCGTDLKSVFIQVDTTLYTGVTVTPAPPGGVTVQKQATGVKVTGLFGTGAGYDVSVSARSGTSLAALCGAGVDGCKYRLEGGFALNQPYGCCPQHSTGV
ncbi:hypothetical protein HYH03_008296 [Edaphochlamys debaryana]|uniref:Pherophorin domain-containing protein n=1 Tax=Edaphochlamys debaryana TaxID=47281 RepID=A0A836BYD5_9CHLO|nr:hypothetical protein HYH03_008296 [Edaphochlamys debaryana]|eukprot:KAG2493480.1 hypothetical protein HYH03_008296 [Edaphochlamys debaryana]